MDTAQSNPIGNEPVAAQAVTDEELFEAYLAARLQQAVDTLNGARDELAAQPGDFNRALQVMRQVHDLRELRTQLDAQRSRVAAARSAAGLEPPAAQETAVIVQTDPTVAFRETQAEQAANIMAVLATKPRTCPACQAMLASNASACRCGHQIAEDAEHIEDKNVGTNAPSVSPSAA